MEESKNKLIESVIDHAIKGETSSPIKGDAKKARDYWNTLLVYVKQLEQANRSLNDEKTSIPQESHKEEHGELEERKRKTYTDRSQQTNHYETNEDLKARELEERKRKTYTDRSQQTNHYETNEDLKARELQERKRKTYTDRSQQTNHYETSEDLKARQQTPNLVQKLRQENGKLKEDMKTYRTNIEELETRLSTMAGLQLTAGNPNIADLSDPYRPTLLGEQFREFYDNEWTDLLTYMEKHELKERESIDIMCEIIQNIDEFCLKAKNQRVNKLFEMVVGEVRSPELNDQRKMTFVKYSAQNTVELNAVQEKTVERFVLDIHKALSSVSCVPLNHIFDSYFMEAFRTKHEKLTEGCKELTDFVSKAIQLLWMMQGHLPPLVLMWCQPDQPFDKVHFSFYTCKGEKVSHCIWPAVLLYKDGPLIARGIAQGK